MCPSCPIRVRATNPPVELIEGLGCLVDLRSPRYALDQREARSRGTCRDETVRGAAFSCRAPPPRPLLAGDRCTGWPSDRPGTGWLPIHGSLSTGRTAPPAPWSCSTLSQVHAVSSY